jgi:hypothetical protein
MHLFQYCTILFTPLEIKKNILTGLQAAFAELPVQSLSKTDEGYKQMKI